MTKLTVTIHDWEIPATLEHIATGIKDVSERLIVLTEKFNEVEAAQNKLRSMCKDISYDTNKNQ